MKQRHMLLGLYGLSFAVCLWGMDAGAGEDTQKFCTIKSFHCPPGYTDVEKTPADSPCKSNYKYLACRSTSGGSEMTLNEANQERRELAEATKDEYKPEASDPCGSAVKAANVSANGSGAQFSCGSTYTTIDTAKISNSLSQSLGSTAVNLMAQSKTSEAQTKGTQSALMEAAGETQVNTGKMQIGMGVVNAALGAYQLKLASEHGAKATSVASLQQTGQPAENPNFTQLKNDGQQQHETAKKNAQAGAAGSLIVAAQQIAGGGFNIAGGNRIKGAAEDMAAAEDKYNSGGVLSGFNTNLGETASVPRQTGTVSATGEQAESDAATDESADEVPTAGLGNGFNPDGANSDIGATPTAGQFKLGGGGGGSGGGGGGVGGGSTSAASGGGDEGSSTRYAESGKSAAGYNAGAGSLGGKGGGGAGGNGGVDLSGLLAQFLPKKEEDTSKNGILDFGGFRDPASMGNDGSFSVLDKNANIFDRISETYKDKHQRGYLKD